MDDDDDDDIDLRPADIIRTARRVGRAKHKGYLYTKSYIKKGQNHKGKKTSFYI